jgi:cytochrome c553
MDMNSKKQFSIAPFLGIVALSLGACTESTPQPIYGGAKAGHVVALNGGGAGAANACIACHGLEGQGDGTTVPFLAGMDQGYLHRQLDDYASGRRNHSIMSTIARRLLPRDRANVATYYMQLALPESDTKVKPHNRLYQQGDVTRGLLPCASCHGEDGEGVGPANPALAQQPSKFTAAQLQAWKRGDRQNDPEHVMLLISQMLTDREIDELSAYLSKLPLAHQRRALATSPRARHDDPKNDASAQHQYGPE